MPAANHYDFICDFDPADQALGNLSARLPHGWRLATTSLYDSRGNKLDRTFIVCPKHAALLATYSVSIAAAGSQVRLILATPAA